MSEAGPTATPAAVAIRLRRNGSEGRPSRPLSRFVARRAVAGLVTLLVVSFLSFLATNALPGDVAESVLGKTGTPESVAALRSELHLGQPVLERYLTWLGGALHGDLGRSAVAVAQGASPSAVSSIIGTPLRNSLILALFTIAVLVPLALIVGAVAGLYAGSPLDYAVSAVTLGLAALPEFVLGTFLLLVFFAELHLLPPVALVEPGTTPLANISDLVLPVMTLVGVSMAFGARQVRAGVIEALRQEYVVMARLNGIPERRVLLRYALRNALAATVQTIAQSVQYLFGGIVVVEALFAYPGVGSLLVQAVAARDVSEVQGIAIVLAAIYITVNVAADVIVVFLVPKLRTGLT